MTDAPMRLLYVDHRLVDLLLMQIVVRSHPRIELQLALNGAQAIELAAGLEPAALLIGMDLPDDTGDGVLRKLRCIPHCVHVPAVALTADGHTDAIALGFDRMWSKPLNLRTIGDDLDALCRAPGVRAEDPAVATAPPTNWPSTIGEARACVLPPLDAARAASRRIDPGPHPRRQEQRR